MGALTEEERRAWLELAGSGLGWRHTSEALKLASSPRELLTASDRELRHRFGLDPKSAERFRERPATETLQRQEQLLERHGIDVVPMTSPAYPRNLFAMRTPPPVLFVKGALEDIDALAVGIVGPRNPTSYGTNVARALARDFAPTLTVVSGAAMGIDSTAHEAALAAGGRTIAVLGCGIDQNYPARNERLRQRIGSGEAGAIVSIFPPGTPPLRGNFPQRNLVLAGLCLAVVIVEASATSGALVSARAAADEGRPVYAVPGDITRNNSAGSNALLREGAIACTCALDVLADMEGTLQGELEVLRQRRGMLSSPADEEAATGGDTSSASPPTKSPAETVLLRAIRHSPLSHDELIHQFVPGSMSMGDLSSALLTLEMNGSIQQMPGRIYAPKL